MKIFISYAREDIETARKLYHDLKQAGITPWMDKEDILIGENWKIAIRQAMKESSYFLALLSSNSLSKQGYVQKELKMALDILAEMPPSGIFFLPIRLDDCHPLDERLQDINWGNLFPSYEEGLNEILRVLTPGKQKIVAKQPIRLPKIPAWLTILVLSAIIIAGIIRFYPSEKKTRTDSSVKIAAPTPTSKPDPPVMVTHPPAQKTFTNALGMKFVEIPTGSFMMGSPPDEPGRYENETQHKVTISMPFFMQTTEVTQGQWKAVMGNNPSYFKNCGDDCPVERVSWDDIQDFIKKLNQKGDGNYRLPTEAEWEYAARAGTETAIYSGNMRIIGERNAPDLDPIAWYGGNSGVSYDGGYDSSDWKEKQYDHKRAGTHPVGKKKPNAFGLYDILGNVWEWCQDWYGDYLADAATDPVGPSSGSDRELRGGGWCNGARLCRSADRNNHTPGDRSYLIGFRLVRFPKVSSPA